MNFRSKCNGRVDDVGSLGRLRCNMQKIPFNLKHQALLLQARLSKGQIMSKEKKHNFCLNIRYRNSSCRGICKRIGIKRVCILFYLCTTYELCFFLVKLYKYYLEAANYQISNCCAVQNANNLIVYCSK